MPSSRITYCIITLGGTFEGRRRLQVVFEFYHEFSRHFCRSPPGGVMRGHEGGIELLANNIGRAGWV